jgi:hypothetical protein
MIEGTKKGDVGVGAGECDLKVTKIDIVKQSLYLTMSWYYYVVA